MAACRKKEIMSAWRGAKLYQAYAIYEIIIIYSKYLSASKLQLSSKRGATVWPANKTHVRTLMSWRGGRKRALRWKNIELQSAEKQKSMCSDVKISGAENARYSGPSRCISHICYSLPEALRRNSGVMSAMSSVTRRKSDGDIRRASCHSHRAIPVARRNGAHAPSSKRGYKVP